MNIKQALQQARLLLTESSPSAELDAQVILSHVLQCNTAHLAAWPEKNLNQQQADQFQHLIQQRKTGHPVAHLTGTREFWSLNFLVNNSTLIPRPESETLVEFILQKFADKTNMKLLDMGTGTGAIAIAIAKEKPEWQVFASDISEQALKLAKQNCNQQQTNNITLLHSNWFEKITQQGFNIIVSNPPYIAKSDPHLAKGDVRFEPHSALTSGVAGMDDIEQLCLHAKNHLVKNGWLIVEHGYNQQQRVADCFTKNGYTEIEQRKDLAGHTRMTAAKYM